MHVRQHVAFNLVTVTSNSKHYVSRCILEAFHLSAVHLLYQPLNSVTFISCAFAVAVLTFWNSLWWFAKIGNRHRGNPTVTAIMGRNWPKTWHYHGNGYLSRSNTTGTGTLATVMHHE